MRKNITVPDDWATALTALATKRKTSFSRLLYEAAAEKLSRKELAKLETPKRRGRPKARQAGN